MSADDRRFMLRALELAERGRGGVAPNPMVGAVVVSGGHVVGEGWHAEYGGPHAEVEALRQAGERARGATLYVTLEPCAHTGKTPPCADAVIAAGIARLVYGCPDPNPVARGGAETVAARGIEVVGGVEEQRARDQNARFLHALAPATRDRPFVELKLAVSLDAKIADRDRRSRWITGEQAREEVQRLRAGHDAIAVGIGTALADDPHLTVRGAVAPRVAPARIVFDRRLRLPPAGRLGSSARAVPLWVVAGPGADPSARGRLEAAGAKVLTAEDLGSALAALKAAGIGSIFVEGGAELASSLLTAGVVDRLSVFIAPILLGPAGVDPFAGLDSPPIGGAVRWRRIETRALGADTLITLAP